jgi:sulfite exporter TauE/SafE
VNIGYPGTSAFEEPIMFLQIVAANFLLGLSASPACLGVCLPVLIPHIGVVGGERPLRAGFAASLFFAAGRLVIYLGLGMLLFALGTTLQAADLRNWAVSNASWIGAGRFLLAILVVLYGISVVFNWPRLAWCQTFFQGPRQRPLLSILLGALAGSILCPALWLAFLQAAQLGWQPLAWLSIVSFWLGSSLFVITAGVSAGALLRHWRNLAQVRGVAGATLIFVGALYLIGR